MDCLASWNYQTWAIAYMVLHLGVWVVGGIFVISRWSQRPKASLLVVLAVSVKVLWSV